MKVTAKVRARASRILETDTPVPKDQDEFRKALVRRVQTFIGSWRACAHPLCKRARSCRGPLICLSNLTKMSPSQRGRSAAKLKRAVERRLADFGHEPVGADARARKRPARITR